MIAGTTLLRQSRLAVILMLALFIILPETVSAQTSSKTSTIQLHPMAKVINSVVRITTRDESLAIMDESLGLIISEDGLIITTSLFVKDAYLATASVSDGTTYFVDSIQARDVNLDLALLRIRSQHMPAIRLSDGVPPSAGTELFALKSWKDKKANLLSGKVSSLWQTSGKIGMYEFDVLLGGKAMGGPVVDKNGQLTGISNTVSRSFRRSSPNATTICPVTIIAQYLSNNINERGRRLASAANGAFGADGANKLEKMWRYLDDEQYEKALHELRVMPSLLQDAYIYLITLGVTQLKLNQFDVAAKTFAKASQANLLDANPAYYGGVALRSAKRFEESILAFQDATQRNPQHLEAYIAMGRSYNAIQQPSLALDVLSKALALDANSVDAHLHIGISYWGLGDRDRTMDHLMQASMIAPRSSAGIRATALLDSGIPMPDEQ